MDGKVGNENCLIFYFPVQIPANILNSLYNDIIGCQVNQKLKDISRYWPS